MKRILATTAIVALTATNAFAASHAAEETKMETSAESSMDSQAGAMDPMAEINGMTISASELIGQSVYVRETEDAEIADTAAEADPDWEDIGEVGDVIVTKDGGIHAITLDVGGFLGMGEKEVSTSMDELKFVQEEGSEDDYFIVYTGNRAALEERDELDRDMTRGEGSMFYTDREQTEMAAADMETSEMDEDAGMADDGVEPIEGADMEASEDEAPEGVEPTVAMTEEADMGDEMMHDGLTANNLIGLSVYDSTDERIGEISDMLLANDGKVTDVIVDVGGFLGIGEKPVALSFEKINVTKDEAGATSASTEYTLEELEGLETWEG